MEITSKTIELKTDFPIDNLKIENELSKMGYDLLRWAIVNVEGNTLTINLACKNL